MSDLGPLALVMLGVAWIFNRVNVRHADTMFAQQFSNQDADDWELGCAFCAFLKAIAYGAPVLILTSIISIGIYGKPGNTAFVFLCILPSGIVGLSLFVRFNNEYLALKK